MKPVEEIRLHLEWCDRNPRFNKSNYSQFTYYEVMNETWNVLTNWELMYHNYLERPDIYMSPSSFVEKWWNGDILQLNKLDILSKKIEAFEKQCLGEIAEDHWAFITVGFNEQTITPSKMLSVSKKISELKYFKSCEFVLEKHRENGIHHHTHFLVRFHGKQYLSKMLGWVYQVRGMKDVCLKREFIDILGPLNKKKDFQSYQIYHEYIRGNKRDQKLKYVELDRKWREENGIDHLYSLKNE